MSGERDIKASIVAAATDLFARFGLEKTTMEDIARASGKGKSSLYYYFKSKEEVFAEVIEGEIRKLKSTIAIAVESNDDPRDQFRSFVFARQRYLNEKTDQYTTIRDDHLKNYSFIKSHLSEFTKWEVSLLRSILEAGRQKGLFEFENAKTHAKAFYFALKSIEFPWETDLSKKEIAKNVRVLIDVLLKGIGDR